MRHFCLRLPAKLTCAGEILRIVKSQQNISLLQINQWQRKTVFRNWQEIEVEHRIMLFGATALFHKGTKLKKKL